MTDLYERRVEATVVASNLLRGSFDTAEVVELAEYLLHGKQTSGEETQTLGSRLWNIPNRPIVIGFDGTKIPGTETAINQTFGGEIDLDALSIRILENLDLIGDASWHEEEDEVLDPTSPDFGEIRAYTSTEFDSLPVGTRVQYLGSTAGFWEKRSATFWNCGYRTMGNHDLEDWRGRRVLNPEILGTFCPVEA